MIIDKTNPDHAHFPDGLDGEVLLETTYHPDGKVSGYVTASQEVTDRKRKLPPQERAAVGWDKYQAILDALPAVLPKMK